MKTHECNIADIGLVTDTGPKDYAKAPIAIQVVGQKQNDQALLTIAETIDSIVRL
jgi:Asp-tRNA(Asn)/Glu-tRNA(Gln) amidotransferase A subunit family amidase